MKPIGSMLPGGHMEDLIRTMAQALVDEPDRVSVFTENGLDATLIKLSVARTDVGKVIGKGGQTVQSMRTILHAVSTKNKRKALLEIVE